MEKVEKWLSGWSCEGAQAKHFKLGGNIFSLIMEYVCHILRTGLKDQKYNTGQM